jgi:putative DNA primase/helicase
MDRRPPRPDTFNGDLDKLTPALAHLKDKKIWVCWCWYWDGKKWTKPPRRVDDPTRNASSADPSTWGSHAQAVAQVNAGRADGVGIALMGCDVGGVDLDHCCDVETSNDIAAWAQDYVDQFPDAYREVTVSGTGLRILGTSGLKKFAPKFKLPDQGNGAAVELFSGSNHYLTVSCNEISDCKVLPEIGGKLKSIAEKLGRKNDAAPADTHDEDATPLAPANGGEETPANAATKPWTFAADMRLRSALAAIPTDEKVLAEKFGHSHDIWVKIGRAIEWLDWGERGYAIWRDWSAQNGREFNEKGLRAQWGSFKRTRNSRANPITVGTVLHLATRCGWTQPKKIEQNDDELIITNAADVTMCGVDWLWPDRFAKGKLGLIAGLPDMGKGQIAAFLTAAVTNRVPLPCDEGIAPQGGVIWFNAEDDTCDTVKPRLVAAGADPKRVHFVNGARVDGKDKSFNLVTDLRLLHRAIARIGNVALVIIDPVSAYLGVGKIDGRSATDVRGVLTPLKELAEELHIAVIGIAHFNKKDDVKSALLRVSDSIAYVAAARHVYAVLDDPDDKDRKLFVKAKNNLAPDTKALRYGFGVKTVGHDAKLSKDINAPFVVWHPQHIEITANEAMQGAGGQRREARELLLDRLRGGPMKSEDLIEEAKQEGIPEKTLRRAKKDLGIKSRKDPTKFDGQWTWELTDRTQHQAAAQSGTGDGQDDPL